MVIVYLFLQEMNISAKSAKMTDTRLCVCVCIDNSNGAEEDHSLPFTTSTTSQLGSMLPICLGWAGFTLPSKINATGHSATNVCDSENVYTQSADIIFMSI